MAQVLIIDNNEKLLNLYTLNLKTYVGVEIIAKTSLEKGLEVVRIIPELDLIICKSHIDSEDTLKKLFSFVQEEGLEVPIIGIGTEKSLEGKIKILEAGVDFASLIKETASVIGVTAKDMMERVTPDYFPIPLKYFYSMSKSICDVYVRVKKNEGDFQFIKRIHADDNFKEQDLDTYKNKGINQLYVEAAHRLTFVNSFSTQLISKIDDPNASVGDQMKNTSQGMEVVADQIKLEGLSPDTVEVAKSCMRSLLRATKNSSNKIKGLVSALLASKSSYRYQHTQLVTFISAHVISCMDWGSQEQSEKLAFVAFFHDIALESDEMAKIHSDEQLENSKISDVEKEVVKKHALLALDALTDFPASPLGADIIIKQHHGKTNGIGFAEDQPSHISPLAIVFRVAEALAEELLESSPDFDMKSMMEKLYKKFDRPRYRKIVDTFSKIQGL